MSFLTGLRWLFSRVGKSAEADIPIAPRAPKADPLFPPNAVLVDAAPREYPSTSPPRAEGAKSAKAMLSRGYRNRNPGNIDWLPPGRAWDGQTGKEVDSSGGRGRFGVYATHEDGIRAIGKQVRKYQESYGLHTIRQIINQWAPPVENATNSYIARVDAAMTRHGADDRLDLSNYLQLRALVEAIIVVECGGNPYQPEMIDRGVRRALA